VEDVRVALQPVLPSPSSQVDGLHATVAAVRSLAAHSGAHWLSVGRCEVGVNCTWSRASVPFWTLPPHYGASVQADLHGPYTPLITR
jgi:hypothetical protein